MNNTQPEITVVMAVYNGRKTLRQAIECILNQTFHNFEYLIVDDCSTDDTVEIIQSYDDPRIRLYQNPVNLGQTRSLNVGLEQARAPYIARMDVDDWSVPTRLAAQWAFMRQHPEFSVVGTDCLVVDAANRKKRVSRGCAGHEVILRMLYGSPINHVSVLMRTEHVRAVGGYRPEYVIAADFDLWSRFVQQGYHITTLSETLMHYAVSDQSYSSTHSGVKNDEVMRIAHANIRHFSGAEVDAERVTAMVRLFCDDLAHCDEAMVDVAEQTFREIIAQMRPAFRFSMPKRTVRSMLVKNYWLAAYHLVLQRNTQAARRVIRRCVSRHGWDPVSMGLYLFTCVNPQALQKLNYLRSKYFSF